MADRDFLVKASEAEALIGLNNADAALAYIYIRSRGAEALPMDGERAAAALRALASAGLAENRGRILPQDSPPEYTASDVRDKMARSADFTALVRETERRLGRILSGSDLTTLFGLYDYLGLPSEVLLLLIASCSADWERKYGEGRAPGFKYIEKEAYAWARLEINTAARAEEHIRRRAESRTREGEIRRLLGIQNRALSPTEARYIASWGDLGFSAEAVALAYDRTVIKTGALNWKYMDSIMRSWHQKGLHTPEEIERGDSRSPRAPEKRDPAPDREGIERMRRYADRIKGGGD